MINTLLEHVPIKMEVKEPEETNSIPVKHSRQDDKMANDDEEIDETDDGDASDEEDVDEEDEEEDEESDIETDALEIEKEATMLISSDEEAELEAQRIRFPNIAKNLRRDSNCSSRSSTRSSQTSNSSCKPRITYEIVKQKDCTMEETNNKQRISPRLNHIKIKKSLENYNKENNNKTCLLKQKTENKHLESNKNKSDESANKTIDSNKTTEIHKSSENNHNKENFLKSSVNVPGQTSRRESNNSTCSVDSTMTSDSAEIESCGNIYVFNLDQKLIFNCEFCDLKYSDLDNFGLHLHEAHKLFSFDEDPEKENAPRNLGKTNQLPINGPKNCANIKKEPLHSVELKAESPVILPPSALAEPLDSCGNVFMINHRKLFLFCGYCECKYANLELFEKHLRQQHQIFEGCHNELNVVPKVVVKEEIFVVGEVADKPDNMAPQPMVAIPTEISLAINITAEKELETLAAVAQSAVQMEVDREETYVQKETTGSENVTCRNKHTAVDKTVEPEFLSGKEQSTSPSPNERNDESHVAMARGKESHKKRSVIVTAAENENKEKSVRRKASNKRRSLTDEQFGLPNKLPKRTTRNNTRNELESPTATEKEKLSETEDSVVVYYNCSDVVKTKETTSKGITTKPTDTLKDTAAVNNPKPQKTSKSTKLSETEKKTHSKKTPTRDLKQMAESVLTTSLNSMETVESKKFKDTEEVNSLKLPDTKELIKTEEFQSEAGFKLTETGETLNTGKKIAVKLPETKKKRNSSKLTATGELRKTDSFKRTTALHLTETEKSTDTAMETDVGHLTETSRETLKRKNTIELTTTRETRKHTDVEKTDAVKNAEMTETLKISLSEKIPPVKLAGTTETGKITNLEKTTAVKLSEKRQTNKSINAEKTSPKLKATRKSRKTTNSEKSNTTLDVLNVSAELMETDEKSKTPDKEKTTTVKLHEARVKKKPLEPEKKKSDKLTAARESRTNHDHEKTTAVKLSETRETRKSTKLAAIKNTCEAVESENKLPAADQATTSTESKNLDDGDKSKIVNNKLKCSMCSKEFTKKSNLIRHERTHQTDSNKRYGCGICFKDFWFENERNSHMQTRHNVDAPAECNNCYRAFSSKRHLERHNEKVHVPRLFKCGECLRTYISEVTFKRHIYVFHPNSKKTSGKNKSKSIQKINSSKAKQIEAIKEATLLLDENIKNVVKADQVEELVEELHNAEKEMPTDSSTGVMYAINDLPLNIENAVFDEGPNDKPININDAEMSNVTLETPVENAVRTYFVADLNNRNADGPAIQQVTNQRELEKSSESIELIDVINKKKDTTQSLEPRKLTFVNNDEEDDLTADPVSDIIEQLQNELAESSSPKCTTSTANNMVTYTINSMPNSEETQTSVVLDTQLNVLNKTEDVKPTFLKIVKHFVCDVCSKTYYKHARLIEHKRLHTGEKPYGCDECGKQFRVRSRLNEHKQRHSKEKKFKCEICQLPLCTRQDYNLHMRHHTNDRRYHCSVCPKAFVRSSDLKIHERIHTGEKPYVCDICHKCFRANQNLSVHKKSHMGDISKTFKCDHCDKKFMRKIDRKVHMRTHTGEKPYKCEICQRGYSSRVNVRAHIDRDHIKGAQEEKKKPGPKPRSLREELERQKKLIEELQNQLLQQIKSDEKIILSEEEMQEEHILPDNPVKLFSPITTTSTTKSDPVQNAYKLLNKLKASSSVTTTTTSKSLTLIPSPTPLEEPLTVNDTKDSTTSILPLTVTQKLEEASPAPSSTLCLTTPSTSPSPPAAAKTTATKIVSQKTSLGIQQVSVTVSMQVENLTANSDTVEKDNSEILSPTSSSGGPNSVKKERKITSYFSVLDQKSKG